MDYLRGNMCWEEQGTFVYEVLANVVTVRSHSTSGDQFRSDVRFVKGDLVAVDLVRPSRVPSEGPYLRLSDGSGWLMEMHGTKSALVRRNVETGLWTFFIDNFPLGQSLIRHPVVNRLDLVCSANATFPPMRRIYCDRRVTSTSKIEFFRVQGTKGWIVGRGMVTAKGKAQSMLLPEGHVTPGICAYKTLDITYVYARPFRKESFKTLTIAPNELLYTNLMREADENCFARLIDGSGWIPLKSKGGERLLDRSPIVVGSWKMLSVSPSPIRLLRQPLDRDDMICESKTVYKYDSEIECDQRIQGANGVVFYKVKGTDGFVPDKRGEDILLARNSKPSEGGWSPDFVRGIASLVPGVYESEHDLSTQILSFASAAEDQPVIKVYYATRMVTTYPSEGPCRRNCDPQDLVGILKTPASLKDQKEDILPAVRVLDADNCGMVIAEGEEAALRHELVDCYVQSEQLKMQQLNLLRILKQCDDLRGKNERDMALREEKRSQELEHMETQRRKGEKKQSRLTCKKCGTLFKDMQAKRMHLMCIQKQRCLTCSAMFSSLNELLVHQDKMGHGGGLEIMETSQSSSTRYSTATAATIATNTSYDSDFSV